MSPPRSRRLRASLVAGLVLTLALLPATASAKPVGPVPSRLLVTAREFSFSLSKPKLPPGPAIVELYNYGEDPHDMKLQRVGGARVFSYGETAPGGSTRLEMRLKRASRYRLWCSLDGHVQLGMSTKLRVARKRR